MKRLLSGLFIAAGVVVLAVGVLAGVELLLTDPKRSRRASTAEAETDASPSAPVPPSVAAKPSSRNFSIKRTKSEVGYVYWILEGYGRYKCFVLCDSWDEAVEQAKIRTAEIDGVNADVPLSSALA